MKETGSPELLFDNLDLTPVRPILWKDLHREGPGRPVKYNPESDLRALMLRHLEQIPYVKDLVKRLRRNPYLRRICGYGDDVPTEAHFSQMKRRIGEEGFRAIERHLRCEAIRLGASHPLLAAGLVQASAVDGADLPAWSSRDPHDTRKGLGDREARLGRGPKGFYLGYRSLFLVDMEGFPLGHVEAPANVNEKEMVEKLLEEALGEDLEVELVAGDSQFESKPLFTVLEERKIEHLIPWRKLKHRVNPPEELVVKGRIDVEGPEWKRAVYKRLRAMVEGYIGRVKTRLHYHQFTWKGLANATIHNSLTFILVYAVAIAAMKMGRPDLARSIAYFA